MIKYFGPVWIAASVAAFLGMSGNCDAGITYPPPPAGGWQVASKSLASDAVFFREFRGKKLTVATPYIYYIAGAEDVISGRLLRGATPMRWIYPVMMGDNCVGAECLDVAVRLGKAPEWIGADKSSPEDSMMKALRVAEGLPQIKQQDYEVRVLDVMELQFFAVWLHGKSDDIIIPVPNGTAGLLKACQPYSESQVLKILKPDAKATITEAKKENQEWLKAGGMASGPPPVQ